MLGQRQLSRKLSEVGLCYGIELGDASTRLLLRHPREPAPAALSCCPFPNPPAPPYRRRIFLFPQVLGEPYAIVREHHPVTCLCGVQIDIGRYREITVAFRIVENLAHMPYVG